jgi:hypothetical protein
VRDEVTTMRATYANAAGTDVVLEIDGAAYAVKPDDPRLAAVVIAPFDGAPAPRSIAKTTIYRRASDAELTLLEATVAALPLRERLLWQDAAGGVVLVADVEPFFTAAVGAERAAELLAP